MLICFSMILYSCTNENKEKITENIEKTSIVVKTDTFLLPEQTDNSTFSQVGILYSQFKKDINENKFTEDSLLVEFLKNYSSITDGINSALDSRKDYDSLNTLAYSPNNVIAKSALEFEIELNKNHLTVDQSEGMIFVNLSPDFLKNDVSLLLSDSSKEFLNLYIKEIENRCCGDASLMISKNELIKRVVDWGAFITNYPKSAFIESAYFEYRVYIDLLFTGQDNSPVFDWETNMYDTELLDLMYTEINEHPSSMASSNFVPFINIIKEDKMLNTEKVKEYIKIVNKELVKSQQNAIKK